MVAFQYLKFDGSVKQMTANDESWLSMIGFHNFGLRYHGGISPLRIIFADNTVKDTYVNGSGYEVEKDEFTTPCICGHRADEHIAGDGHCFKCVGCHQFEKWIVP